jgi:hypothetical protein
VAEAMLRLAGLDDLSLDLEEARLMRELVRLRAKRAGVLDVDAVAGAGARPGVAGRG